MVILITILLCCMSSARFPDKEKQPSVNLPMVTWLINKEARIEPGSL
jgi:hypothetical protein